MLAVLTATEDLGSRILIQVFGSLSGRGLEPRPIAFLVFPA